jgi:hypothetical protein
MVDSVKGSGQFIPSTASHQLPTIDYQISIGRMLKDMTFTGKCETGRWYFPVLHFSV